MGCELPLKVMQRLGHPEFPTHLHEFIYYHIISDSSSNASNSIKFNLPTFNDKLNIFTSAVSIFFAPSDLSGIGGMHCECICAMPSWQRGPLWYDPVLINADDDKEGLYGMEVAHVWLFFSFTYNDCTYPCAYIDWYTHEGEGPDADMGMWIVSKGIGCSTVIHLDSIIHCTHLIPVYGQPFLPSGLTSSNSLDVFSSHYVSKYADQQMFKILG